MKKWLFGVFLIFLLSGCGEQKYIDATRSMKIENNIHLSHKNIKSVEELGIYYIYRLTGDSIKDISSDIKYSIVGNAGKNKKMVEMNYNGAKVRIPVEKNGDSFSIDHLDIKGKFGKKKYTFEKFTREVINEKMNIAEKEYEDDIEEYIDDCKKRLK